MPGERDQEREVGLHGPQVREMEGHGKDINHGEGKGEMSFK